MSQWVLPLGAVGGEGCDVLVDDRVEGWAHTGLRVVTLGPGQSKAVASDGWELIVVPLSGAVLVHVTDVDGVDHVANLAGRPSVFAGPTDVAYVPSHASVRLTVDGAAAGESRIAVCAARVGHDVVPGAFAHVRAADVPVELRGAGVCSREVRNFGVPGVVEASSIIACEVVTPAGNWSSYPPHKHDEERPGEETELEEIYYFETQVEGAHDGRVAPDVADAADPVGYQRVYGTDSRPIDVLAEVRTGDVVLVPYGWHGPAMAAPGYDLYYLNVMAGPGETRAWLICDDPSHGWVRQTWRDQGIDPRLPFSPQSPQSLQSEEPREEGGPA